MSISIHLIFLGNISNNVIYPLYLWSLYYFRAYDCHLMNKFAIHFTVYWFQRTVILALLCFQRFQFEWFVVRLTILVWPLPLKWTNHIPMWSGTKSNFGTLSLHSTFSNRIYSVRQNWRRRRCCRFQLFLVNKTINNWSILFDFDLVG